MTILRDEDALTHLAVNDARTAQDAGAKFARALAGAHPAGADAMSDEAPPTPLGALMSMIQTEIARCDPITVIYARHAAILDVSYEEFCRMITPLVGDATLIPKLTPVSRAPVPT